MTDEESRGEDTGREGSLTEQAGETTAADMVSGPEDTRPVGADTEVEVGGPSDAAEKEG